REAFEGDRARDRVGQPAIFQRGILVTEAARSSSNLGGGTRVRLVAHFYSVRRLRVPAENSCRCPGRSRLSAAPAVICNSFFVFHRCAAMLVATARDEGDEVSLGQDADQAPIFDNRKAANLALVQHACG